VVSKRRTGSRSPAASAEWEHRRSAILRAASDLFAEKGVLATTVRDIGDGAGLLSGSLYHYFPSKDAMVEEIVITYLNGLASDCRRARADHDDPVACLEALVTLSFAAIEDHRSACLIYQNDAAYLHTLSIAAQLDDVAKEIHWAWLDVISVGVKQGRLRADVDPSVYYRFARDALWSTVRWYKPGGGRLIEDVARDFLAVFLHGIAIPSKPPRSQRRAAGAKA
jgi:TetR/AcrR family transcriptional regulator, cholesterol catabolism regulator